MVLTSGVCCDDFNGKDQVLHRDNGVPNTTELVGCIQAAEAHGIKKRRGYWVEMRWTIMRMMREPRGQVQRSMLGLLILSSSS